MFCVERNRSWRKMSVFFVCFLCFLMENMIFLSSQVKSAKPRNIPQDHWKQDTTMRAKSIPVPLGLHHINTISHSLEFLNITIPKNYKYLMSCMLQLIFILKRAFSLIGIIVSPHFLVSLNSNSISIPNLSSPSLVSVRGCVVDKKAFMNGWNPRMTLRPL